MSGRSIRTTIIGTLIICMTGVLTGGFAWTVAQAAENDAASAVEAGTADIAAGDGSSMKADDDAASDAAASFDKAQVPKIRSLTSTPEGLVITWQAVPGADSYTIYRRTGTGQWECIAGVGQTAYTDSTLIPGEKSFYYIKAYDKETNAWGAYDSAGTSGTWEVAAGDITAGSVLSEKAVQKLGEDAFFYVEEISDETFARMWGKSFKEDCTIPRESLRYIRCLHKDINGQSKVGELVMHEAIADTVCGIFRELYHQAYPIQSMILIDEFDGDDETSIMANNTSAFNFRTVDNTDEISRHAYGLAIDINPYYNVYYIESEGYIFPEDGWQYLDRDADFPYKLAPGDPCYELFADAGFEWGGWWVYNTDYQHFQYTLD